MIRSKDPKTPGIAFAIKEGMRRSPAPTILLCAFLAIQGGRSLLAWSPGTGSPNAAQDFVVDTTNRNDVLSFCNCIYNASQNFVAEIGWSGTVSASLGVAGTTSTIFKEDVRRRINLYRALASMPADIAFDATDCARDQDAALMFSRNGSASHTPPANWLSYTSTGAEAAANSNLAVGFNINNYGPAAIDGYLRDDGAGNEAVGHRRWLLYSQAQLMGTGDIPVTGTFASSNANWVVGNFKPSPVMKFVTWPNSGFIPLPLVPTRWSVTYSGADFSKATVSMTHSGTSVPVQIISSVDNGYGDNSIVWVPSGMPPASIPSDQTYQVTVSGIAGAAVPSSTSYGVTLFDPDTLNETITITGTNSPDLAGAVYTFNGISGADSLNLEVSTGSTAAWTEGAEDSPTPQVRAATTGSYALRESTVKNSGTKAFHLTFPVVPDFSDQSFQITRIVIPSGASNLIFHDCFRFVTTVSRLSAEISTDNGGSWTEIWGRNGNGSTSSAGWDAAFATRTVSLAGYAGTPVLVRFIFRAGDSAFIGQDTGTGVFIDDITITNGTELVNTTGTILSTSGSSFELNAATAGAPLAADTAYYLRIQPSVGLRWYGFGAMKIVTTSTSSAVASTGSVQMFILPAGAPGAGAKWQVDSGPWLDSGSTVSGLTPGNHAVNFNTVNGWISPGAQTVAVAADATTTGTGSFTAAPGSGVYFHEFTNAPLWDLSGSYSGTVAGNLQLDFLISEDPSGKIIGNGFVYSDDHSGNVLSGSATITGAVRTSGTTAFVSLTMSIAGAGTVAAAAVAGPDNAKFAGTLKLACEIDGTSGMLRVMDSRLRVLLLDLVTGIKSTRSVRDKTWTDLALPADVTGDWSMSLNLVPRGNRNTGSALVQTSTGGTAVLGATGSYTAKTGASKLTLKGGGGSLGMVIITTETTWTSQGVKGKLFGQRLNFKGD